jgi:hypothetical protein
MAQELEGRMVRLDYTSDPYTSLRKGDVGEVMFTDAIGTVHVKWRNGSDLGLIPGEDVFTILPMKGES